MSLDLNLLIETYLVSGCHRAFVISSVAVFWHSITYVRARIAPRISNRQNTSDVCAPIREQRNYKK
jgi:hypothetical protein